MAVFACSQNDSHAQDKSQHQGREQWTSDGGLQGRMAAPATPNSLPGAQPLSAQPQGCASEHQSLLMQTAWTAAVFHSKAGVMGHSTGRHTLTEAGELPCMIG